MTTRTPVTPCPHCGEELDAATRMFAKAVGDLIVDTVPSDGDVSICFTCGHIMVFEGGAPRNPTTTEMYAIAGDPRIIKLQRARAFLKQKP